MLISTRSHGQGALSNGGIHDASIVVSNQVDTWTFTATNGDNVLLHGVDLSGNVNFYPRLRLYTPANTLIGDAYAQVETRLEFVATNSGTYTLLVSNASAGVIGSFGYRLRMAKVPGAFVTPPGDDTGTLTNGAYHDGVIDLGDDDFWTFTVTNGDNVLLHGIDLSGNSNFYPWLRLYNPAGKLVADEYAQTETRISFVAPTNGTYTVLVGNASVGVVGTNSYRLRLVKVPGPYVTPPGDDTGTLTNGAYHDGVIDLGDDDFWTFTVTNGDNVLLHGIDLSGNANFYPWLRLYNPAGKLIADQYAQTETRISFVAPTNGTYTVLVGNASVGVIGSFGYRLRLTKVPGPYVTPPGDDTGALINGSFHDGVIDLGDDDFWTFTVTNGDNVLLHGIDLSGNANFYPWLRLYNPAGVLVADQYAQTETRISFVAPTNGTYTVLVGNASAGVLGTNNYRLRLANSRGAFVVPPGDEGGSFTNGANHDGVIELGDDDFWQFTACRGDAIVLRALDLSTNANFYPWLRLFGPTGSLLATDNDQTQAMITYQATNSGTFRILVGAASAGSTGNYRLTGNGLSDGLKLCVPGILTSNLTLNGVGGASNGTYVVLTTTNIASPSAAWSSVRTNQFDSFGVFSFTNQFNSAERQRFFRLSTP